MASIVKKQNNLYKYINENTGLWDQLDSKYINAIVTIDDKNNCHIISGNMQIRNDLSNKINSNKRIVLNKPIILNNKGKTYYFQAGDALYIKKNNNQFSFSEKGHYILNKTMPKKEDYFNEKDWYIPGEVTITNKGNFTKVNKNNITNSNSKQTYFENKQAKKTVIPKQETKKPVKKIVKRSTRVVPIKTIDNTGLAIKDSDFSLPVITQPIDRQTAENQLVLNQSGPWVAGYRNAQAAQKAQMAMDEYDRLMEEQKRLDGEYQKVMGRMPEIVPQNTTTEQYYSI